MAENVDCWHAMFPAESSNDNPKTIAGKEIMIATNKANWILIAWLVVAILAMWVEGDDGDRLLSIAAALAGVAFSQIQKLLDSNEQLAVYTLTLPFIGGLVLGSTAAADGADEKIGIAVTVLSGVVLWFIMYTLRMTRYPHGERVRPELKPRPETTRDATTQSLVDGPPQNPEERRENYMMGIAAGSIAISLLLAIAGTVMKEESDVDVPTGTLPVLGISVAWSLVAAQLCTVLDEKAIAWPFVEFVITFLTLTADVLPLAIELTLEEDKNNPNVMMNAAWVGAGAGVIFFPLVTIPLLKARWKKREDQTAAEFYMKMEAAQLHRPEGTENMNASDLRDYFSYKVALEERVENLKKKDEATALEFLADAEWENTKERDELEEQLEQAKARHKLIEEEQRKLGQKRGDISPLPSEPPVEWPTVRESQLTFVPQGYYAEPGADGVPRFVKEGYYRTRPDAFQQVSPQRPIDGGPQTEDGMGMRPGMTGTEMSGQAGMPQPPGMLPPMPGMGAGPRMGGTSNPMQPPGMPGMGPRMQGTPNPIQPPPGM